MLPFFSPWRLCLGCGGGLFITFIITGTYSTIQDQGWNNIDTTQQISDMVAPLPPSSEPPLLGLNGIPDTTTTPGGLALGIIATTTTADGRSDSEFVQTPHEKGSDIFNQDGILVQGGGGSGCPSSDNTRSSYPRSRRIRARKNDDEDESMCPNPPNQHTRLHLNSPNSQDQDQDQGVGVGVGHIGGQNQKKKNTGGNGNGDPSKQPQPQPQPQPPAINIPSITIPPEDSKLPYLFIPEQDRPKKNPDLCPDPMHPVPVCGRPTDTYLSSSEDTSLNQFTLDPCYPCMKIFFF